MTKLVWDQVGQREFEAGVDRGVLYLDDRSGVAWNGLTSVEEDFSGDETEPIHFEGEKVSELQTSGDFAGTLTALTYPDEFVEFDGSSSIEPGLIIDNQPAKFFHLCYRSLIGNDLEGTDHGYKIHILYNLIAEPSNTNRQTIGAEVTPLEFEWGLTSIPEIIPGYKPTAHAVIDSRNLNPEILEELEEILYGTETDEPYLPSLAELTQYIEEWGLIIIEDNGDGTWTARGPDELITMLDSTTFQITEANAEVFSGGAYTIQSSIPED
jgi:hypothetical protein